MVRAASQSGAAEQSNKDEQRAKGFGHRRDLRSGGITRKQPPLSGYPAGLAKQLNPGGFQFNA
jgi:hypothetical protein